MDTTIVSKKNNKYVINISSEIVNELFESAISDIDVDLWETMTVYDEVADKLNDIQNGHAESDFSTLFENQKDYPNERKLMVWDLAWAIHQVGMIDDVEIKNFFDIRYNMLDLFKNHSLVEGTVASYFFASQANSFIDKFHKTSSTCERDTTLFLQDIEKDRSNLLRKQNIMISNLQETIKQIDADSQRAIEELRDLLMTTIELKAELQKKFNETKKEMKDLKSESHVKNVGESYLRGLIEEYIKPYEESDDQEERKRIYNELWNFISSADEIPKDIKERIKKLRQPLKKKQPSKSVQGDNNGIIAESINMGLSKESEEKLVDGLLNKKQLGDGNRD